MGGSQQSAVPAQPSCCQPAGRTTRLATWLAIVAVLTFVLAGARRRQEFGPENQGLRLRLAVSTAREGTGVVHHFTLDLKNVSSNAISVVCGGTAPGTIDTFEAEVVHNVRLASRPRWPIAVAQIGSWARPSEPRATIPPGGSIKVAWSGHGADLKPEGHPNTYPRLELDGLYFIRASLLVQTPDGTRIRLESNEVPLSRNGSVQSPKVGAVTITHLEGPDGAVYIDAGADHGIVVGDRFDVYCTLDWVWTLEVDRTFAESSQCRVVKRLDGPAARGEVAASIPSLPRLGSEGGLILTPKVAPAP